MVGVCRINKGYQPIDGAVRRTSALLRRHAYRVTPLLTCGIQAPLLWICFWVCINKKRAKRRVSINILAERGGFEPPIGYEPIHAFQACDLNHSSTSPEFVPDACVPDEARNYSKACVRSAFRLAPAKKSRSTFR